MHCFPSGRTAPLIIAGMVASLAAGPALAQNAPPPPQVTVARPLVRDVVETDDFIGRFQAFESVSIRARVGGYLDSIAFRDGQIVEKGDQLFQIDERPFTSTLNEAKARLAVAQSTLVYAQAQFDRVDALVKSGSQSVSTLDERRRELESALANIQGSQASLERAELDLVYSRITSPISGRISRHLISVGNLVQADQTELTTVVALDPIDFYFDVDERRLLNYAETARKNGTFIQEGGGGLQVTVRLGDANQSSFVGKVDFAENSVDPATGTLRLRARLDNPDYILQPGLFGRVAIEGSNTYSAMLIPDEAIGTDQNERVVFVLQDDNTVTTKAIRPGPKLYGYRVVRSGLDPNDTIVVRGVVRVRPGARVTPVTTELPQENPQEAAGTEASETEGQE